MHGFNDRMVRRRSHSSLSITQACKLFSCGHFVALIAVANQLQVIWGWTHDVGLNTVLISVPVQHDISLKKKIMVHRIALGQVQHQAPAELMFTGLHYHSQWVITAFPGTPKPSNLTCLLAWMGGGQKEGKKKNLLDWISGCQCGLYNQCVW